MNRGLRCVNCGKRYDRYANGSCWIECSCGEKICGKCGSTDIVEIDDAAPDSEFWCHMECASCGRQGCGGCI